MSVSIRFGSVTRFFSSSKALVFQSLCIGSMPKRCPYRKYEENLDEKYSYSAPCRRSFDALTTAPIFDQTFSKFDGQIPVHLGFLKPWFFHSAENKKLLTVIQQRPPSFFSALSPPPFFNPLLTIYSIIQGSINIEQ